MNDKLISVESVPHNCQRYDTVGDWQFEPDGSLTVNISEMPDKRYMWLVAIHEIVEAMLCKINGISQEEVDAWDISHLDDVDPGGIRACPYHVEHIIATSIEAMLAAQMGVGWDHYENVLEDLKYD